MATRVRKAGEFCWINLMTPNPAEAMGFFDAVLGWSFFEMPGIGHGMRVDGHNIGGFFDSDGPNAPPGMSPTIGVMVKVDDANATAEKVTLLGGTARPAFDVGEQGRMAVCFDPNGGEFDIWEPKKMPGSDADPSLHGAPSWSEAMTTDVARASAFYTDLFGWTSETRPMSGMEYTVFKLGETDVAGLMPVPHEAIPPHWGTYFTVDDADETARLAKERGGKVFVPPMDIAGIGRFSGLISPQGVRFYVISSPPGQRV